MKKSYLGAIAYCSVDQLRRALLLQARLYHKTNSELAATPILLSPGVVKAPPKPAKTSDLDKLDLLLAQVRVLKNIETQLITSFKTDPTSAQLLASTRKLIQVVTAKADEFRRQLAAKARTEVSQSLVRTNHDLVKSLQDDLKGFFETIRESYLVGEIYPPKATEPILAEIAFVRIDGLKGEDGYRHPTYYIILAHPIAQTSNQPGFLLATSVEFRVPTKIRWEASARSGVELRKIVKDLLAQDGIMGKAFTRNIPVAPSRIKFAHSNIKSTTVRGDIITVKVKDPKKLLETRDELRKQLAGIVRSVDPKNKDLIRDRIEKDTGTIKFVFSLPGRLKGRLISSDALSKIKTLLDLSPEELTRVKTALENPED